jgi:hypothetical protein
MNVSQIRAIHRHNPAPGSETQRGFQPPVHYKILSLQKQWLQEMLSQGEYFQGAHRSTKETWQRDCECNQVHGRAKPPTEFLFGRPSEPRRATRAEKGKQRVDEDEPPPPPASKAPSVWPKGKGKGKGKGVPTPPVAPSDAESEADLASASDAGSLRQRSRSRSVARSEKSLGRREIEDLMETTFSAMQGRLQNDVQAALDTVLQRFAPAAAAAPVPAAVAQPAVAVGVGGWGAGEDWDAAPPDKKLQVDLARLQAINTLYQIERDLVRTHLQTVLGPAIMQVPTLSQDICNTVFLGAAGAGPAPDVQDILKPYATLTSHAVAAASAAPAWPQQHHPYGIASPSAPVGDPFGQQWADELRRRAAQPPPQPSFTLEYLQQQQLLMQQQLQLQQQAGPSHHAPPLPPMAAAAAQAYPQAEVARRRPPPPAIPQVVAMAGLQGHQDDPDILMYDPADPESVEMEMLLRAMEARNKASEDLLASNEQAMAQQRAAARANDADRVARRAALKAAQDKDKVLQQRLQQQQAAAAPKVQGPVAPPVHAKPAAGTGVPATRPGRGPPPPKPTAAPPP